MTSVVVLGSGGHAAVCIEIIERSSDLTMFGVVTRDDTRGAEFLGYPIVSSDQGVRALVAGGHGVVIGVGKIGADSRRAELFTWVRRMGAEIPQLIDPDAYVSARAYLGHGAQVMRGATVGSGARVGDNTILNSHSLVEHGVQLGANTHVAPGALICGDAIVGESVFIGSGAVIREGVKIGVGAVVGAGALILGDIEPGAKVFGRHR